MRCFNTHDNALVETLFETLSAYREGFSQARVFAVASLLALGSVFSFARKTVSQLLVSLGETDSDWTKWYRLLSRPGRIDYGLLVRRTLVEMLDLFYGLGSRPATVGDTEPFVMAIDATHVPRTGKMFAGSHYGKAGNTAPFKPGIEVTQRFENVVALSPIEDGFSRAIPLALLPAPPAKCFSAAPEGAVTEWAAGLKAIGLVRSHLNEQCPDRPLLVLGDGTYDVNRMWQSLPAKAYLLSRCSRNRRLHHLPPPRPEHPGPGAPAKYAEQHIHPYELRAERGKWDTASFRVRGRDRAVSCRVRGPYLLEGAPNTPMFLLLVRGSDKKVNGKRVKQEPTQYLINAQKGADGRWTLPFEAGLLVRWAWHRWEIEVSHRQMKTSFGMGQMQCWSKTGSTLSVQFMHWAYSVLVLTGCKCWGAVRNANCTLRPPGKWWSGGRRWSFSHLLQGVRRAIWSLDGRFLPVYSGTTHKPAKNSSEWLDAMLNSVAGSSRG